MKKKLLLRLCLLTAILLSIYSCRTEDQLEKNYRDNAGKFRVLVSKDGKPVNYAHGFKYLLERYDKLHGTAFTRKTAVQNYKLAGKGSSEFIEFNIHSQDLIRKKGDERWIMYPVISNGIVSGIAIAILKEEETNLQLWRLDEKDPYYKEVIGLFREQYKNSVLKISSGAMNKGGERCGFEGEEPCDIKEVVITVPGGGPKGDPKMYKPGSGTGGGYCQTYGNCYGQGGSEDDGGGGEGPPADTTKTKDPCEELKLQNTDARFKEKVSELDKAEIFNKSVETGYAAAYGSVPFEKMFNNNEGNVRLPTGNKYYGYMHAHLNKEGVVKIFSPYDLATFLTSCLANAKLSGSMADAYGMVITSEGNYILKYSGDGNFAVTVGQLESWEKWYNYEYSKLITEGNFTQANIEKLFTQFLQEEVNINGVEIYKSDKTSGNPNKLSYNGKDNPVESTPCPN